MLKKFLVDYSKMNKAQMPSNYAEYYESMYKFWSFLEKSLIQARLQEKYQALITKSLFSNPVEAQDAFDARVDQSDLLLAAVPYSSIVDSTIVIKDSDLKAAYDKKKEQFKQYVETRNIKFIDVQVTASAEDRAALQKEMEEYTEQLIANPSDYTTFIRSTGSETPYTDLFYTTKSLPADVTAVWTLLRWVVCSDLIITYRTILSTLSRNWLLLPCRTLSSSVRFKWLLKMLKRRRLWPTASTMLLRRVPALLKLRRNTVRPVSLPGFLLLITKAHRLTVTT